jgi:hypothetical protein
MAGTELMATSTTVNPASTTSAVADDALRGWKMIIVMIRGLIRRPAAAMATDVASVHLRQVCLKDAHGSALLFFHLLCAEELGW